MGKALRDGLYRSHNSPGPGAYDQKLKMFGPQYHFGGRHAQSVTDVKPGPGQYTPDYTLRHKTTVYRYSIAGRPASASQAGPPGPGSYDSNFKKEKKLGRFGKDPRRPLDGSENALVPGPGAYERQNVKANLSSSPHYTHFETLYSLGLV